MSRAEDQTQVLLDAAKPECGARGDEPHATDCPDPITFTPPCTCDATGEQPHAEDCPRAKRLHAETHDRDGRPILYPGETLETLRPRSAVDLAMARTEEAADGLFGQFHGTVHHEQATGFGKHEIGVDVARPGAERTVETLTRINEDGNAVPDLRSPREVAVGSNPFVQKREALQREMVSSKYTMRRRGRMIPERGRMVVARVEWDEKIGSIFILDGHKKQLEQSNQEAVIMACGPLRIDPATGKEVPMRFSIQEAIGKHIVIREHSGIEFVTHDENGKEIICYWIGQSEIWGWLEPYPGDEANSPEIWKAIAYLGEGTTPTEPAEAFGPTPGVCPHLCLRPDCFNRCANMHSTAEGHVCLEHLPI